MPTGAVQFEDDWPGLFVRGDDALELLVALRAYEEELEDLGRIYPRHLRDLCPQLRHLAALIERDVDVREDPQA